MPDWPVTIVGLLARAAVLQLVAWLVVRAISSRLRYSAPQACRMACLVILLQGVLLLPMTVSIPWYDPPRDQPVPIADLATLGSADAGEGRANLDWTESEGAVLLAAPTTEPRIAQHETAVRWDWSTAPPWLATGLVVVWLAGMAVLMARSALTYVCFASSLPRSLPAPPQWHHEWEQLLSEHGVRRRIPLILSETLGPMLCLLPWGYALLVPEGYWLREPPCGADGDPATRISPLPAWRHSQIMACRPAGFTFLVQPGGLVR